MKSAPPGNSSILNFFKPKQETATQQSQTQSQSQTLAGSQSESNPQQSPPQGTTSNTQPTPQAARSGVAPRSEVQMNSSATRNGKLVVRSSDSEDSDDSSDLDELPIIRGTKTATSTVPSGSLIKTPPRTRAAFKFDPSPIPVRPRLKNDLAALVKQSQQDKKEDATREVLRALLEDDDPDMGDSGEFDAQELLDNYVPDDEDDSGRLVQAMKRQEAGKTETRWFFFDIETAPKNSGWSEFPKRALSQCRWKQALTNPSIFRQTILTGFADDMVAMGEELPEELLLWMLDELCFEGRGTVRHSYCRIISCHPSDTVSRLMNTACIQKLFRSLGGTEEAVQTEKSIGSVKNLVREYKARSWDQLISVVTLLGMVARSLSEESCNYSICLLAKLGLDSIVVENLALFQAIQNSIKSLVQSIPGAHWTSECKSLSRTIFDFTESSTLQLQVLQCIPDQGIPRLRNLRRQLSISLFFKDPSLLTQPLSTTLSLPSINKHLSSSHFLVTPSTDYRELSSDICLLDIAVADGQTADNDNGASTNEEEFNTNVDKLVSSLEVIESSIRDASAAHMARTDAKNAIKVVSLRIGTMRTKRKPRHSIWGPETSLKDLRPENAEMMDKWLKKKEI